ncbi:MAG: hypothetical protein KBT34_08240 [Prevotella sp.]|nr:hypothetical protein [Candidatus Prevotella equi]
MKKLRLAILTMAFLGMTGASFAQGNNNQERKQRPSHEEMIERKADRMVVMLGLSDKDAAKFKDIYVRHEKENAEAWQVAKQKKQEPKAEKAKKKIMTDSEIDAQMKARFEKQAAKAKKNAKFYDELRTVLSARQAQRVLAFEKQKQAMRGKMKGHRVGNRQAFAKRQHPGQMKEGMPMQHRPQNPDGFNKDSKPTENQ